MARLAPLEPPLAPEVADQLARMMPPGEPPIALFRLFAKNLPMTEAMLPWGSYELGRQLTLSRREREIAILRTCARCGCEYEWGVHVARFAERAGLVADQVTSLTWGEPSDACWSSERERLLIEAVDALHATSDLPDDLWGRLAAELDEPQVLDLLLLTGWYHAISFAAHATRVPLEAGAPRFEDVGSSAGRAPVGRGVSACAPG